MVTRGQMQREAIWKGTLGKPAKQETGQLRSFKGVCMHLQEKQDKGKTKATMLCRR